MPTLKDLAARVRINVKPGAPKDPLFPNSIPWTVTLTYQDRTMNTPFYMGPALRKPPNSQDVLECLLLDASGFENTSGFEEWCREHGYDDDSRRIERVYRKVEEQTKNTKLLLGDDYDLFLYAEH